MITTKKAEKRLSEYFTFTNIEEDNFTIYLGKETYTVFTSFLFWFFLILSLVFLYAHFVSGIDVVYFDFAYCLICAVCFIHGYLLNKRNYITFQRGIPTVIFKSGKNEIFREVKNKSALVIVGPLDIPNIHADRPYIRLRIVFGTTHLKLFNIIPTPIEISDYIPLYENFSNKTSTDDRLKALKYIRSTLLDYIGLNKKG